MTTLKPVLTVRPVSDTEAVINWSGVTRQNVSITYLRSTPTTSKRPTRSQNNINASGNLRLSGLEPSTMYQYYVRFSGTGSTTQSHLVRFTTAAATVTPMMPDPMLPMDMNAPSIPAVSSGLPMRYEIIKFDLTKVDITRQVAKAKLRYGYKPEKRRGITFWNKSSGDVRVADWRKDYLDAQLTWDRLNIYAGTVQVFAAVITSIEASDDDKHNIDLGIELLGSASLRGNQGIQVSVGTSDVSLQAYLQGSGLELSRVPNVMLPDMFVAAGFGYPGVIEVVRDGGGYEVLERFSDNASQFIQDVSTFGTMFIFERRVAEGFRAYPLSALYAETRGALATVAADGFVRRKDFSARSENYQYDRQRFNLASAATANLSGSKGVSKWKRVTSSQQRRLFDKRGLSRFEYQMILEFDDFLSPTDAANVLSASISNLPARVSASSPAYGGTGGGNFVLGADEHDGGTPNGAVTFRWSAVVRKKVTLSQREFVSDAPGIERSAGQSSIAIPTSGANFTKSAAAIKKSLNAFDDFRPYIVGMTNILPQTGDLNLLLREPGDLVDVRAASLDFRYLLVSVEFQHRGLRPIELRWELIETGPIPQASPFPDPRRVTFGGMSVAFAGESVYF